MNDANLFGDRCDRIRREPGQRILCEKSCATMTQTVLADSDVHLVESRKQVMRRTICRILSMRQSALPPLDALSDFSRSICWCQFSFCQAIISHRGPVCINNRKLFNGAGRKRHINSWCVKLGAPWRWPVNSVVPGVSKEKLAPWETQFR